MNQLRINNLYDIDPFDDNVGAFSDGVLNLLLPKKAAASGKRLSVG
jgi:hypothetical protein